jgi:hypothetical protein
VFSGAHIREVERPRPVRRGRARRSLVARRSRTVAQGFRERIEPGGAFGLHSKELGDGIAPALDAAVAVGGAPVVDHGRAAAWTRLYGLAAERWSSVCRRGFCAGHGPAPKRYVTQ